MGHESGPAEVMPGGAEEYVLQLLYLGYNINPRLKEIVKSFEKHEKVAESITGAKNSGRA